MVGHLSTQDAQLSSLAAGFTVGLGIWTATRAVRQTKLCKNPRRSIFIYMVWGEIVANLFMGILAWLAVNNIIDETLLFFIVFTSLWVFEIHLYYQIIINRCGVVAADRKFIKKLKIGTATLITIINISVYAIWIPANLEPPPVPILVVVNRYWDPTSKVILLFADMALNWYFLYVVRRRLIKYHGLLKYKPLVRCNAWLMVISVLMDVLLIGLEVLSLHQGSIVFDDFHPLVYVVKLHIELSMAALITKVARAGQEGRMNDIYTNNFRRPWGHERRDSDPTMIAPVFLRSGNHTTSFSSSASGSEKSLPQYPSKDLDVENVADLATGVTRILVDKETSSGIRTTVSVDVRREGENTVLLIERDKFY